MNRISLIGFVAVVLLIGCGRVAHSQDKKPPLRLVQTISLPNVKGRLDHMDLDVKGQRLFVAGLENGTFEVVDLQAGKWVRSIPGFKKAQGALFVPELNKLFLASGDDGMVRVFRLDHPQHRHLAEPERRRDLTSHVSTSTVADAALGNLFTTNPDAHSKIKSFWKA
jgi:hypothetical protein